MLSVGEKQDVVLQFSYGRHHLLRRVSGAISAGNCRQSVEDIRIVVGLEVVDHQIQPRMRSFTPFEGQITSPASEGE